MFLVLWSFRHGEETKLLDDKLGSIIQKFSFLWRRVFFLLFSTDLTVFYIC